MSLRDLVYLDFPRLTSLHSQLGGGLLIEATEKKEESSDGKAGFEVNLPLLRAGLGGRLGELASVERTTRVHHELLGLVETALKEADVLVEIDMSTGKEEFESIRQELVTKPYVKVTGHPSIESFDEISTLAKNIPGVQEFFARAALEGSPEYQGAKQAVAEMEAKPVSGHAAKQQKHQTKQAKVQLASFEKLAKEQGFPTWQIDGVRNFIEVFYGGLTTVRIFPWPDAPEQHVLGRLSLAMLSDIDYASVAFSYGRTPSVDFTMLGSVSSLPPKGKPDFDALSGEVLDHLEQFYSTVDGDAVGMEVQLRRMTSGIRDLERMVRLSRYPNVTVIPLAVYREIPLVKRVAQ